MVEIKSILNSIGETVPKGVQYVFNSLFSSLTITKLFTALIFGLLIYLAIKGLNFLSKPLKYILIAISILLIISIISTLFT